MGKFYAIAMAIGLLTTSVFAVTPADKAVLQAQALSAIQQVTALKGLIDLLPLDIVPPPPPVAWPRNPPNMLDIDLVGPRSVIAMSDVLNGPKTGGAKWLDSNKGVNGTGDSSYDNTGQVFHYSSLAGGYNAASGTACDMSRGWTNWDCKFTSWDTCPTVKWGVESNGLHYLESCTDGNKQTMVCNACRIIDWKAGTLGTVGVREIYWRDMGFAYQETWDNDTELGIKRSGVGGAMVNGSTFAEIFELGKKTITGGWVLQSYRYDAEGQQGVTVFPNVEIKPMRWYTFEGHVKVPSCATCADGVIEFKVDGLMVFSRKDVKMGASSVQGYNMLWYHGGTQKPSGILRVKTARIALSTTDWIGPAPEVN